VHTKCVEVRERSTVLEADVSPQIVTLEHVNGERSFISRITITHRFFVHYSVIKRGKDLGGRHGKIQEEAAPRSGERDFKCAF
jgi:hypothetical protein